MSGVTPKLAVLAALLLSAQLVAVREDQASPQSSCPPKLQRAFKRAASSPTSRGRGAWGASHCWLKDRKESGVEMWLFRRDGQQIPFQMITAGNVGNLKGQVDYTMQQIKKGASENWITAWKVLLFPDTMAEYFHGLWDHAAQEVVLDFRLNCMNDGAVDVCCTRVPASMARVGIRHGTVSRQVSKCRDSESGCYKDACMKQEDGQAALNGCSSFDVACWFAIPHDKKNVQVLLAKGPTQMPSEITDYNAVTNFLKQMIA